MNIFEDLLAHTSKSSAQPELLEMLGHKAAQMYQQGIPLNDAITKILADHPELGNEHVKRVVEFANNATFQDLFQKSQDKNIHFQIADPGVVLRDLKDGGSPAHDGKTMAGGMGDYRTPPKESEIPGDSEVQQLFQDQFATDPEVSVSEQEKIAEAHQYHADPVEDLYEVHTRLLGSQEKLAEAHELFANLLVDAKEDLYQSIKQEIIDPDGAGLGGVAGALEKFGSRQLVNSVLEPMTEKLLDELGPDRLTASLHKCAGKVLNMAHPIAQAWAGIEKAAVEVLRSQGALAEVAEHLQKTSGALTSALRSRVGGKLPAALRQRVIKKGCK